MTHAKAGEHFRVIAEIDDGDRTIPGVRCDVSLPKRSCGQIQILCWPNQQQWEQLKLAWEISLRATLYFAGGEKKRGDIFIVRGRKGSAEGHERANVGLEYEVRIVPYDLIVTEYFHANSDEGQVTSGEFWITPSSLLSPSYGKSHCSMEGLRIESIEAPPFKLLDGIDLQFANSHVFFDNDDHSTTVQLELVARFSAAGTIAAVPTLLPSLDDLLMFGSLAERKQIHCVGWSVSDSNCLQRHYRRNIAVDKVPATADSGDPLIKKYDAWEFLGQVYQSFQQLPHRELLKLAIDGITSKSDAPSEIQYMGLFSALQSLVLLHKRTEGLKKLKFRPAYAAAQQRFGWEADDLWPVADKSSGQSLYCIRNHIEHGDPISENDFKALAVAKLHLQWTIERALLAILGWPLERSTVSSHSLGKWHPYKDWCAIREQMNLA
jgi:hypothetical protein